MSYFNEDQQSYIRSLASIPRADRCECGWSRRGECYGACYGHPEKGGIMPREDERARQRRSDGMIALRGLLHRHGPAELLDLLANVIGDKELIWHLSELSRKVAERTEATK